MKTLYTFKDFTKNIPIPGNFTLCKAFRMDHERDMFLSAVLPATVERTGRNAWDHRDMRGTGWRVLPYGYGVDAANKGAIILFDREYRAICSISKEGKVTFIDAADREWEAVDKVWFYSDGSHPARHSECRRILNIIVQRYGLGWELKRRAVTERHGMLPGANDCGKRRRSDWAAALEAMTVGKRVFAFDTATGQTLRVRPPVTNVGGWKPRPVTLDDLRGISSWLNSKGMRAAKKDIERMVDVIGAGWPVTYLPDPSPNMNGGE